MLMSAGAIYWVPFELSHGSCTKLLIVAVGLRVPDWAQTAWYDYAQRYTPDIKDELKAVTTDHMGHKTQTNRYAASRARLKPPKAAGKRYRDIHALRTPTPPRDRADPRARGGNAPDGNLTPAANPHTPVSCPLAGGWGAH